MSRSKLIAKARDVASQAAPSTSPALVVSERLTDSEIESLRQDLKDKADYLKTVYPNLRQAR